jgi:transposase
MRPSIANNWTLHHDNAPYHKAISVIEFLAKKGILVVPQPPYSPDLSPCYFFFFFLLKFHLKGRHFRMVKNIEKAVTNQLKAIPVTSPEMCSLSRELF